MRLRRSEARLGGHLRGHGSGLGPNSLLVLGPVLAVAGVGLGLSRVLDVRVVQEILDAQQNLEQQIRDAFLTSPFLRGDLSVSHFSEKTL